VSSETVSAERRPIIDVVRSIGFPLVVASALAATFALVVAQLLDDFGDGLLAEILGGNATLYNNRVEITGASNLAWGGGFVLCLLVGLLLLFSYPTQRGHGVPRLISLWLTIHILRQALTQALALGFSDEGQLGLAYATFDLPAGLDIVISAAGGVGLVLVALGAAPAFLGFAAHRRQISNGRKRFLFVLWFVLAPAVAAVFLAYAFLSPDAGSEVLRALPLTALMFLITLAAAGGTTSVRGPEDERKFSWPYGLGATVIALLIFEVVVLRNGVSIDPTQWG
jgi:hypothetical protein